MCDVEYKLFEFAKYPEHVRYLKNYAFKPIIVAVSKSLKSVEKRNAYMCKVLIEKVHWQECMWAKVYRV